MRTKFVRNLGLTLAVLAMTAICPEMVKAETTIMVSVEDEAESYAVGDSVSVHYNVSSDGDAAEKPSISVEYDPNRLEFSECDKEYGGGGGGLVTLTDSEATVKFSILSGGDANVAVVADMGDGGETPRSSVDIYVEGEDTAGSSESESEDSGTGVAEDSIMYSDGTKVISTVFANEYMPTLFHKDVTEYDGKQTETAVFDMDPSIKLVYVTDTAGENGNFNILGSDGTLSDFRMIQGIENRFIIILPTTDETTAPDGFTRVTLQWNNQTIGAYMFANESEDSEDDAAVAGGNVSSDKFFLLYAVSSEGNTGWYLYDQEEGTYQRFPQFLCGASNGSGEGEGFLAALTDMGSDSEEGFFSLANIKLLIIIGMAIIMVVLIVVIINLAMKLRDYQSYDYIDEEDEEMEGPGGAPKAKATAKSLAEAGMNDGYDMENLSDEEDDDADDYDLMKRAKAQEKERKKQEKLAKKNRKKGIPEAMDWESFGQEMNDSMEEDDRRPVGNNVDNLAPQYRNAAIKNQIEDDEEPVRTAPVKNAVPQSQQRQASLNAKPVRQAEPAGQAQAAPVQQARAQAQAAPVQQARPQAQTAPVQQARSQAQAAPVQQARPQMQQAPQQMPQYGGQMYGGQQYMNQQMAQSMPAKPVELDEDFEFEFLDLGE